MGTIVIVDEERCGDCRNPIGEVTREVDDLFSDSDGKAANVKRRIRIARCKKCQPIFEQKINDLKKEGKVKVIPFGVSGLVAEARKSTLKDFIGRDRNRKKKEVAYEDRLL